MGIQENLFIDRDIIYELSKSLFLRSRFNVGGYYMENIVKDDVYVKHRENELFYFQEQYKTEEVEVFYSPDNQYKLLIEHFRCVDGNVRHDYTRGIITSIDNSIKIEINRNYGHFIYEWVIRGQQKYLLCGEDYQGYTIVNLVNQKILNYVPEEWHNGTGFCWAAIHYTPGINVLVVEGCQWACEYEIIFYEFSNPEQLPYKILKRVNSYEKVIGWQDSAYYESVDDCNENKKIKVI